jgi:hypothetical protein
MRRLPFLFVPLLLAALFGTACSQTTPQLKAAGETDAADAAEDMPVPAAPSRRAAAFASLPDRGNLIGYPAQRVARHEPASTWHRADVSEEHALRAVVTGEMTVTAPDGQPIRLRYQRHLEHRNGNWTWIGRDEHGEEAIVTFGEKAVFGSIPRQGGEELRLATSDGRSWVVESDSSKQHYPDTKRPDFVVPPELMQSFISGEPPTASASAEAFAPAAVATTVDVALGYTNGFASELGGDSQAATRLQHLVDVTNQAFSNSQISAQIRLVRTVRVNYADATDNNDALAKLSGYESGVGNIPVDPAFNALRAARDQYGADLVSLVRRFRTPENEGCGVAWLIGGELSRIDSSDAPWGYSVVSDDLDRGDLNESDSKTYVCRKETLAHELGHNMGQAHNNEDSDGTPGAHSYSYGYREAPTTGFYTVMAYRLADSSQKAIRYFANPNVLDAVTGRPTGVANASDNARSMAQTMPLIAGFRSSVLPLGGAVRDFDGDGRSDILWRNTSSGSNAIWKSANVATVQGVTAIADQSWRVAGVGDFDGDGRADIFWRNSVSGQNSLWRSANSGTSQYLAAVTDQNWKPTVGDFDGDGNSDILWRHAVSGQNGIWKSGNSAMSMAVTAIADANWTVAGAGDFGGDGSDDILWYNTATGQVALWKSASSAQGQVLTTVADRNWRVVGVSDFNADGKADILWRNRGNGSNALWLAANSATSYNLAQVPDQGWQVANIADYDGDGRSDILWHHTDGRNAYWKAANSANVQSLAVTAAAWAIAP